MNWCTRKNLGVLSLLWLCSCQGSAKEKARNEAKTAPVAEAKSASAAVEKVEEASFELKSQSEAEYTVGQKADFEIMLHAKNEWKVNPDFPFSIEPEAHTAVQFEKKELGKGDAAEFSKKDIRVKVPFTAQKAGEHELRVKVSFAVCTPENCVPDDRVLALKLKVKG